MIKKINPLDLYMSTTIFVNKICTSACKMVLLKMDQLNNASSQIQPLSNIVARFTN